MLKRICAFCLIIALTVPLMAALPVSAASAVDSQLLKDLGIIDASESTGLIPVSFGRGEFARSLCLMARNEAGLVVSPEESAQYASDIADDAKRNYIAAVLKFGYMETDSEGKFNPGKALSLKDAITALVKMLGYEPVVQDNGGTYEDYYALAVKLKLMSGVSVDNTDKLTADETADILTNAMSAKLLMPEGIHYGEDCLWDRWDIYEHSGKILANSNMGLLVESVGSNRVNIDGTVYYTKLLIENELVGSTVTYYTMKGDKGTEVVSIYVENSSDTVTLMPDDIASVTEGGSVVTVTTEDKKSLKVDKKGFLIVNGKAMSPTKAMFDALDSGSATFVDSDNNGTYEVVHMTLLFQTVIDGVNADGGTLATRYDKQIIDLEKADSYEIYLGKKAAVLSDLKSGMPVGIACDSFELISGELVLSFTDAKYIRLYASSRQETGYITEMLEGKFAIEDMTKRFGSGYMRLLDEGHLIPLQAGQYVTAYYDNKGELTYYETAPGGGLQYGYLIAAATGGSSLSSTTAVKILDTDGKINIYTSGKKFILDGESVSAGSTVYTVNTSDDVDLRRRQLVRYRVTDDVLREIDTAVVRASAESAENSLDAVLPFDVTTTGNSSRRIRSGTIDRIYAFRSDCVVFIDEAPIGETSPSEKQFSVKKGSVGDGEHYLSAYDSNTNNEMACVVRHDSYNEKDGDAKSSLPYHGYNCHVVEEVRTGMNANGDLGWKLSLAGDSKQESYFVSEDNIKLYASKDADDWGREQINVYKQDEKDFTTVIKTGDIIRFTTNTAGDINYIEKMFDFEDHKDIIAEVPNKGGQIYGFASVERVSGNNVLYSYGGLSEDTKTYIFKKRSTFTTVPLYHASTGKVELIDISQIPSLASGSDVRVFLRYYNYGTVYDHIFYIYD